MTAPAIYLAGPEVFLPSADTIGARKIELCAEQGLDGRFPGAMVAPLEELAHLEMRAQARHWFDQLVAGLDACDAVIANLTPFRGASADVGTAWEVGYALARGMPVFAYTNVIEPLAARVEPDGLHVEPFELADNLMLEGAVWRSGGVFVCVDGGEDRVRALGYLGGFEVCVRAAAEYFRVR